MRLLLAFAKKIFAYLIHSPLVTPQQPQITAEKSIATNQRRIVAVNVIQGAFPHRISKENSVMASTSFMATATIAISIAHEVVVMSAVIIVRMSVKMARPCILEKAEVMAVMRHKAAQIG